MRDPLNRLNSSTLINVRNVVFVPLVILLFVSGCGGSFVNDAPVITSTNFSVNENVRSVGFVNAADPNGDVLTFSIMGGADSHLLDIDFETGLLEFLEDPDYEMPLDHNGDNYYKIEVSVSDGFITTTSPIAVQVLNLSSWYKGNTHTHTEFSRDSVTPQEDIVFWYKEHGYSFVVVTDHNYFSKLSTLNTLSHEGNDLVDDSFILIAGEELTHETNHVNGLSISYFLEPSEDIGVNFHNVVSANGLPQLNHPHAWNISAAEIVNAANGIKVPLFIEMYNSVTDTITELGFPGENLWDSVLSSGTEMWGVAVDDSHTMPGGIQPPGGGFIYVDADALDIDSILAGMNQGRFYASTGATIKNFSYDRSEYTVEASVISNIKFIGFAGAILQEDNALSAVYEYLGNEQYVRARIESEQGVAWTQPVFIDTLRD